MSSMTSEFPNNYGTVVSDLGGAVGQLFGSKGASAQANSYDSAALLATQNAQLTAASTRIQQTQASRQVYQTIGTQRADVAGAGFTESGSALDLLASSAQQGALAKSLVNIQGAINENSYAAQAGALSGEAAAANNKATAGTVGAIASLGGALLSGGGGALYGAGKAVVSGATSLYNSIFGSNTAAATAQYDAAGNLVSPTDVSGAFSSGLGDYPTLTGDFSSFESNDVNLFSSTPYSYDTSAVDNLVSQGADTGVSAGESGVGGFLSDIGNSISDFFSSLF